MTSHHVEHYKGCLLDCTPLEAIKGQFLAHVSISHASAPERMAAMALRRIAEGIRTALAPRPV